MLTPDKVSNVYLACQSTDMRKSIDGLAAIVQQRFKLDLFADCLFVFCNRNRNKVKILHWEYNGFWLYYKRLEKGRFQWVNTDHDVQCIGQRELRWLLDGLPMDQPKAHKRVYADGII